MHGKAYVPNLALFFSGFHRFYCSTRPKNPVEIGDLGEPVKLIKIEIIGFKQSKRSFQLRTRFDHRVVVGFASQKATAAILREHRSQPFLGIAVAGRHIEIVDASIDGFGHYVCSGAGVFIHNHNST